MKFLLLITTMLGALLTNSAFSGSKNFGIINEMDAPIDVTLKTEGILEYSTIYLDHLEGIFNRQQLLYQEGLAGNKKALQENEKRIQRVNDGYNQKLKIWSQENNISNNATSRKYQAPQPMKRKPYVTELNKIVKPVKKKIPKIKNPNFSVNLSINNVKNDREMSITQLHYTENVDSYFNKLIPIIDWNTPVIKEKSTRLIITYKKEKYLINKFSLDQFRVANLLTIKPVRGGSVAACIDVCVFARKVMKA